MKTLQEIVQILQKHKNEIRKYGIKKLKIFGSYVENEQRPSSDVDIIVEFETPPTLIELVRIEEELSRVLGVKVDLLTEEGISPYIRPYIKEVEVL
jgi:hypothetical protein